MNVLLCWENPNVIHLTDLMPQLDYGVDEKVVVQKGDGSEQTI